MTATAAAIAIVKTLSPAMRRALCHRQEDLFGDRGVLIGHGMTLKALRRRGVAEGKRPCTLTEQGRVVIAADPTISGGPG